MNLRWLLPALLTVAAFACGGLRAGDDNGGPDRDAGSASDGGTNTDDGGGWTQCSAPGGYSVCGGPNTACASQVPSASCKGCAYKIAEGAALPNGDNDLAFCDGPDARWYDIDAGIVYGPFCRDGYVLVADPAIGYAGPDGVPNGQGYTACVRFEIAQLYAKNGWAKAARYTDFSHFTGDPLPTPSTCPQVPGIQLCGGVCGDNCAPGTHCTGRSPGHPYSVCIPEPSQVGCSSNAAQGDHGMGCFAFSVPPEDKAFIQTISYCVPTSWCQAAAANLPGGGLCDVYTGPRGCFQ